MPSLYSSLRVCLVFLAYLPLHSQTAARPADNGQGSQQSSTPPSGQPTINPAKQANIRKLMELSGAQAIMSQLMDNMEQSVKPLMTSTLPPGEYRDKLIDLFFAKFRSKADIKQLIDKAVLVYDKYFEDDEIKALIQFYQTPTGHKLVAVLPQVTTEMADAGRQWGEELGRQCMQEVLAENPDLAQALETADKGRQ